MTPIAAAPAPALVWDRIAENERRTRRLLTLFALLMIPFALALISVATAGVLLFGPLFVPLDSPTGLWVLLTADAVFVLVVVAAAAALWSYEQAGRAIFRRAGARPAADRDPELRRIVDNLCIGAGLPVPRIHVIETLAPNALTAGLDPERAHIAVSRGLLELLDGRELRGVIAHELSHIGNRDVRLGSVLAACLTVLRLPITLLARIHSAILVMCILLSLVVLPYAAFAFLYVGTATFGLLYLRGEVRSAELQRVVTDVSMACFYLAMTATPPFLLWGGQFLGWFTGRQVLRDRELLADADAFALTRDAEGLACALAKIDAVGASTPGSNGSNAHLYIVDPIRERRAWWNAPIMAHPPIDERIAALQSLGQFPVESLDRARMAAYGWVAAHPEARTASFTIGGDDNLPSGLRARLGFVAEFAIACKDVVAAAWKAWLEANTP